jgi:hypothetical protein
MNTSVQICSPRPGPDRPRKTHQRPPVRECRFILAATIALPTPAANGTVRRLRSQPMLSSFWQWLQTASQGQASFLGTLIGSSIGLVALLLGALFNAHLNRRRDDRLRRLDQRAMAVALKTELAGWSESLGRFVESTKTKGPYSSSTKLGFPVLATRLLPDMVPKLGLLRPSTIEHVITAYDAAEHLAWALLWMGAEMERSTDFHSRWIMVPSEKLPSAIEEIEATVTVLRSAIAELDRDAR